MIRLIRWMKGYVRIKVSGYAPERFMNLCTGNGIMLWDVAGFGQYYEMDMSLSDFFTIRKIVHKTGTRVSVLKRCGLPFVLGDMKKRKVFLAGIICCMVFLTVMQQFLWAVEFQGNQQITDEMLQNFMKENGIHYGLGMKQLDQSGIEAALRERFSQITWVSVKTQGSKITVFIRENDLPPEKEQQQEAAGWEYGADLVSMQDGIITEMITRSGIPLVKPQDTVRKGDVLVTGQIPVRNDDGTVKEWEYCVADAELLIRYEKKLTLQQPFSYEYKNYTGREKKYFFFQLGNKRYVPGSRREPFSCWDEVMEQKRLQLFGQIDLPLSVGTMIKREYLPVEAFYEEEAAQQLLSGRFSKIVDSLEQKGLHIIEKDVKIEKNISCLTLTALLTVTEQAAMLMPAKQAGAE